MYLYGDGVQQDYAAARAWYRKAADQRNADAQLGLWFIYDVGYGVPQDYVAAAHWCRKAADQGNPIGQQVLGDMYANGRGVPQDYILVHMWLNLAAASGIAAAPGTTNAAASREMVAAKMTPAQIAEAQKLAREWKPK